MFKFIREVLTRRQRHQAEINNWHNLCSELQQRNNALEGRCSGLNAQVIELRGIANEMRDRVRSHGMTGSERRFLDAAIDIAQNKKKMSQHRLEQSVREILRERESLQPFAVSMAQEAAQ